MLAKAGSLVDGSTEPLSVHFYYHSRIIHWYKQRDRDPHALGKAIEACEQQIAMSTIAAIAFQEKYPNQQLPGHHGFHQLAIIREKQDDYSEAIRIARQAQSAGWAGDDWTGRVERCKRKMEKLH